MTDPIPPRTVTAYDRVWERCIDCSGVGRLHRSHPRRRLIDCPSCAGQGGWFTEPKEFN